MSLRWESTFHHVWDVLKNIDILRTPSKTKFITKEDSDYSEENNGLKLNKDNKVVLESSKTKINYLDKINFSFNFMRNTFIIVDMSENSILVDFKPNRMKYIFYKLKKFIKDYFSYNYISTITIIVTLNCTAEILSPFSNDPEKIIDNIDSKIFGIQKDNNSKKHYSPGGYFSLYNSLEAIKEILSLKSIDNYKNDILIINNSLLTYDNTIKNEILFFKDKFEINVISLEVPFESLKELAINSGGTIFQINKEGKNIHHYNSNGDMDQFLFYYSCKSSNMNTVKITKPIKLEDFDLNVECPKYICFCHKKYQKIVYRCPECLDPYCYIPFFCTRCSFLNIDNTFLKLLLRAKSDKENKDINNNKCFPYKFIFYYNRYSNNHYFQKNAEGVLKKLMVHEKEFKRITEIKSLDDACYNNCSLGFKFKLVYYYIKFDKTRKNFYIDLKKNIFEDNYTDYADKLKSLFLKDIVRCSGCNNVFDVKDEEDFDNIIIYSNCLDLFCLDCYKYLIDNNIGCLECTE